MADFCIDQFIPHRPRATQLTPQHQRPNRSWTKVSAGGDGGLVCSCGNSPKLYFRDSGVDIFESSAIDYKRNSFLFDYACNNNTINGFQQPLADVLIQSKLIGSNLCHVPGPVTNGLATSVFLPSAVVLDSSQSEQSPAVYRTASGTLARLIEHGA